MQWNHLPDAGGLYGQSPKILDDFLTIFTIKGEADRRKAAKEKADAERQAARNKPGVMKGRRR